MPHIIFCRYGFEKNPRLDLVAKPKLGHRAVTLSYVTDWIEKKLCEVVAVSELQTLQIMSFCHNYGLTPIVPYRARGI